MSADYETEDFRAYFHDDYVHIATKTGSYELVDMDWDMFKQVSEIMRHWKHRNDDKEG